MRRILGIAAVTFSFFAGHCSAVAPARASAPVQEGTTVSGTTTTLDPVTPSAR